MFVWGWGVHTMSSWHVGRGHRSTFGGWLSLSTLGSGVRSRLSDLCGKGLYLLSHLTGLTYTLRKESRFEKLMSVKAEPGCMLVSDGGRGPHCCSWKLALLGSVFCWSALGWGCFALFSHLSTYLLQQFSRPLLFASTLSSSTGSRRPCRLIFSPPMLHSCSGNNAHSPRTWALQACCWDGQQRKNSALALSQSPFTAAGRDNAFLLSASPCPCQVGQAST